MYVVLYLMPFLTMFLLYFITIFICFHVYFWGFYLCIFFSFPGVVSTFYECESFVVVVVALSVVNITFLSVMGLLHM